MIPGLDGTAAARPAAPEDGAGVLDDCVAGRALAWVRPGLRASLGRVLGAESPAIALAVCLGRIARGRGGGGLVVRRAALLVAASAHALRHLDSPVRAPFSDTRDEAPRAVDWLLLASGAACPAGEHADPGACLAVARLCAELHPHVAVPPPYLFAADSPLLSYACGPLLALACGDRRAITAGDSLGRLVRLVEEMAALHCDPLSGLGVAEPHLLSRLALEEGVAPEALRLGWARAAAPIPERSPLRALLAQRSVLDAVKARVEAWRVEAEVGVLDAGARVCVEELVAHCRRVLGRAMFAAKLAAAMPPQPEPEGEYAEPQRTIRMALDALASDPEYHESVEVQRWGGWASEPRVGRLFPIGLCLLARGLAGQDVGAEVDALLACRRADGWRYYDDFLGALPDTDDLGLVLQLLPFAANRAAIEGALPWPMELLQRHTTAEGAIPTWLDVGLKEPPPPPEFDWYGSHCMGVMLNVVTGLVQARWPMLEGYLDRVLAHCLERYEREGDGSIAFYPASYIRFQLARLWSALQDSSVLPSHRARLRGILDRLVIEVGDTQRADGGWGSPMTTAFHLAMLELAGATWPGREAAMTYLATRQEPDGLWPREPNFLASGKDSGPYNFGSRSVTASMCLTALALARG